MSQKLLLVDKNDNLVGFSDFKSAHTGRGKRHRAFVTALFDSKGRILIQKRKHELFDGLWDLTAISHNLHIGGRNESYQEASDRALKKEMGIPCVTVKKVGGFNYTARDGKNCENEYCAILIGSYDGKIKPKSKEVYSTKSVPFKDFIKEIILNQKKYTPWAVEAVEILKKQNQNLFLIDLARFLAKYERFESEYLRRKIDSVLQYPREVADLYEKLTGFSKGGKRLRAYLVWLGYQIGGGRNLSKILPISLAFEIAQDFVLIHDDIMDNSDVRRGKPTIHRVYGKKFDKHYGESLAILLGDIACINAFEIITESSFSDKYKVGFQKLFADILLETAYGQALDIENEYRGFGFDRIMQSTYLKSAKYSVIGPMLMGLRVTKTQRGVLKAIETYGTAVGMGYQLFDDMLGIFGDEKTTGKSTLSDMREGKNTLIIHKAKQLASSEGLRNINQIWGNPESGSNDLKKIREIVRKCGALSLCENENMRLTIVAKKEIARITKEHKLQQILSQIADYVVSRQR